MPRTSPGGEAFPRLWAEKAAAFRALVRPAVLPYGPHATRPGKLPEEVAMPSRPDPVARALAEPVEVVAYDPGWPARFAEEAARLRAVLPPHLVGRIEHIGSTAVPGLAAKPIVDMVVEIPDLEAARSEIAPILRPLGYDFFWRPAAPDDPRLRYAWFARRDAEGRRTHNIHVLDPGSPYWDRLTFRDYLRTHPDAARAYAALKTRAAAEHRNDRAGYAAAKGEFIRDTLRQDEKKLISIG